MTDYKKQAADIAGKLKIKFSYSTPDYKKYFPTDKEDRFVFPCKLQKGKKSYSFTFGQSIAENDNPPHIYDILVCMTKYDPGTFEDFCREFGYDEDSRTAEKTYKAVLKEWKAMNRMFTDEELEQLREIQ